MTNSTRAYRTQHLGEMKRRRARWLSLLACTTSAVAMLGGCGNPAPNQAGWDSGSNDAIVYNSLAECKAAQADDRICDEALAEAATAQGQHQFSRKEQCEAEYGVGHCESRSGGGGGWFVPALTGFMLARAMNGANLDTYRRHQVNGYAGAPVYAGGKTQARPQGSRPGYKSSSRGGFGGSSGFHGGSGG